VEDRGETKEESIEVGQEVAMVWGKKPWGAVLLGAACSDSEGGRRAAHGSGDFLFGRREEMFGGGKGDDVSFKRGEKKLISPGAGLW